MINKILVLIIIIMVAYLAYYMIYKRDIEEEFDDLKNQKHFYRDYKHKRRDNDNNKLEKVGLINPTFTEIQFHMDYRDTITAFYKLTNGKQIFNIADTPVIKTQPEIKEVKHMVNDFIMTLNNAVDSVPEVISKDKSCQFDNPVTLDDWNNLPRDYPSADGWADYMKKMGLPKSIYNDPASRAPIKLLKIDKVDKYENDAEIKYVVYMFLQKINSDDQMLVSVSFVLPKAQIDERKFFENHEEELNNCDNGITYKYKNSDTTVLIEMIYIIGFMTRDQQDKEGARYEDFYNFDGLNDNNMMDQKTIMLELQKKYDERAKEMNNFTANLDLEGRIQHLNPNLIAQTKSFQDTRTINDDLKTCSFYN